MRKTHLNTFVACLVVSFLCVSCGCSQTPPREEDYNPDNFSGKNDRKEAVKEADLEEISYEFLKRVLRKIIKKETVDVNETDAEDNPPLRWATHFAPKYAKLLIDEGADVNKQGQQGIAPLHEAALHGNEKVVKLLLDKGADPKIKAGNDETPLDYLKNFTKDDAKKKRIKAMLEAKMS